MASSSARVYRVPPNRIPRSDYPRECTFSSFGGVAFGVPFCTECTIGGIPVIRLSVTDFRKDVSEALNRVAYKGERIALQRRGKDVAVVVPLEDIELLRRLEDEADLQMARKAKREAAKRGTIPLVTVKRRLGIN